MTRLRHTREDKKRRTRTMFSFEQQFKLEESFKQEHWPTTAKKEYLAKELDMTIQSVRTWFQNRRARQKRDDELKKAKLILQKKNSHSEKSQAKANANLKPKHNKKMKMRSATSTTSKSKSNKEDGNKLPVTAQGKQPTRLRVKSNEMLKQQESTPASPSTSSYATEVGVESSSCRNVSSHGSSSDDITTLVQQLDLQNEDQSNSSAANVKVSGCNTGVNLLIAQHMPPIPAELFSVLVEMMCVAEGGIVDVNSPTHSTAVNDALYGVRIADGARIVSRKDCGFKVVNDK